MRCTSAAVKPFVVQLGDRFGQRFAHRHAGRLGLARAVAQNLDALLVLGQVDKLEVGREGFEHRQRARQIFDQRRHLRLDRRAGLDIAGAPRLREGAHLLFQVEDGLPFLLDDRLPQHIAEQMDVGAESLLLSFVHKCKKGGWRLEIQKSHAFPIVDFSSIPQSLTLQFSKFTIFKFSPQPGHP
jgi:hypothetical protein